MFKLREEKLISGFIGNPGAGKTCLQTAMALLDQSFKGYELHSNYWLAVDYEPIDVTEKINFKQDGVPKLALLDELWFWGADSHNAMSPLTEFCCEKALQARKSDTDIFWTSQHMGQISNRIRDVTEFIYRPKIIACYPGTTKPLIAKVEKFSQDSYGRLFLVKSFYMPLLFNDFLVADLYDTKEIVDKMINPTADKRAKMLVKYKDYAAENSSIKPADLRRKLKARLIIEDGVKPALAGQIVNFIC